MPQHLGSTDLASLPAGLRDLAGAAARRLEAEFGDATMFRRCFASAWTTTIRSSTDGRPFVITGDIPAMWLRDTVGQLRPYLAAAGSDPELRRLLQAVCDRLVDCVLMDPYANAFNDGPTGARADPSDHPAPSVQVWERKYEVDSLCAVLSFGYALWRVTGSAAHLGPRFAEAAAAVVALWRLEQRHDTASPYRFTRPEGEFSDDSLPRDGLGAPTEFTGMTWSGFRPSDDRCAFGYLVPANAAAVIALDGLVDLAAHGLLPELLGTDALELSVSIAGGIARHGVV